MHQRLMELIMTHALTEGTPVGLALRQCGGATAIRCAEHADAGELELALGAARFSTTQARLAVAWPAAADGARRCLDRLPDPRVRQVQVLAVLLYLFLVAGVQTATLALLSVRLRPVFVGTLGDTSPWDCSVLYRLLALTLAVELGLIAAAAVVIWRPGLVPGWRRPRHRAQRAALAAAMHEARAPSELWPRVVGVDGGPGPIQATSAELDAAFEDALAGEEAGHQRLVAAVRATGLGVLAAIAAATTVVVYSLAAALSVAGT